MARFKNVKVDPFMKNQGEYESFERIPADAVFACAFYVFFNPVHYVKSVFLRRTEERDELWSANWDVEIVEGLPDYSNQEQYDNFGCAVTAPRKGDERSACKRLLSHLIRSQSGFVGPSDFIQSGLVGENDYWEIVDYLKDEHYRYKQMARDNRSEIIDTAEELGLSPQPTGEGPYLWSASCPKTNHPLFISTENNTFGCGWCRKKGGPEELRDFVKERRSMRF